MDVSILAEWTKSVTVVPALLGQRQIEILSEIAQYLMNATQAATLLEPFLPVLCKPSKPVAEKIKITGSLPSPRPELSDWSTPVFIKTYGFLAQ